MDVFAYTDYRKFLQDWLLAARERRGFSLRVFAGRAGIGSQGHLKMVIDGKRNLGVSGLERFMNGLRLMGGERLYFRNLVLWNQAASDEERAHYEGRLALLRKCRPVLPRAFQEMRRKVMHAQEEIALFLQSDLTPEEAGLLARQLLPSENETA